MDFCGYLCYRLEEAQNDLTESRSEMELDFQQKAREIESRESRLHKQLESSRQQVDSLRSELSTRLELLKNANEAVVIKVGL